MNGARARPARRRVSSAPHLTRHRLRKRDRVVAADADGDLLAIAQSRAGVAGAEPHQDARRRDRGRLDIKIDVVALIDRGGDGALEHRAMRR